MDLSPRLSALAGYYSHHQSIWDIGCDHGKLGLSFLECKEVKSIHLVDPSLPVIEKLKHLLDSYITDPDFKIHLHHEKGQEIVPGPERKLVLIAGMGGKEILSILDSLEVKLTTNDDVVISPHRDLLLLREKLHSSKWSLSNEKLIFEEGRYYQVIGLTLKKGTAVPLYGKTIFEGKLGEEYRSQQLSVFTAHKDVRSKAYVDYLNSLTQCF